jgi:hypothetical protein
MPQTFRVIRRASPPIRDTEHHATPKPPPREPVDAMALFLGWLVAERAGERAVAGRALAELRELAERPPRKKKAPTAG